MGKFFDGQYYHIYNRGNNGQKIFIAKENYNYFLRLYFKYLTKASETYAYALLPNHFHFIIKVKDSEKISERFRRLFISYTKSVNKKFNRSGVLFESTFKHKLISNCEYLKNAIVYVNTNPEKHNIVSDFSTYKYSSYNEIILVKNKNMAINVLDIFEDMEEFIEFHRMKKYNLISVFD